MITICGIAGFLIADAEMGELNTTYAAATLALGIEHRGRDASGMTIVSRAGRIKTVKEPVPMTRFLCRHPGIGSAAQVMLIHTRARTQGSELNPLNNHPIEYEGVIGVHNGMLWNDFDVFGLNPTWKRYGEVDSEAIFASIHHKGMIGGLENVDGSMATAFIYKENPNTLQLARGSANPLWVARSRKGSLFFASTQEAVLEGAIAAGLNANKEHCWQLGQGDVLVAYRDGDYAHMKAAFDYTGRFAADDPSLHSYRGWTNPFDKYEAKAPSKALVLSDVHEVHLPDDNVPLSEYDETYIEWWKEHHPQEEWTESKGYEDLDNFLDDLDDDVAEDLGNVKIGDIVSIGFKNRVEGVVTDIIGNTAVVEWFPGEVDCGALTVIDRASSEGVN